MARRVEREVVFSRDGKHLTRTVSLRDGKSYAHTCTLEVYEDVAHSIEEAIEPTTLSKIAEARKLPCTQVNVALEFFKDRGMIEIVRRRSRIASRTFFEDAMTEFHAL